MSMRRELLSVGGLVVCVLAIAGQLRAIEIKAAETPQPKTQQGNLVSSLASAEIIFDTLCARGQLNLTLSPGNSICQNPVGPILLTQNPHIETIMSRGSGAPYGPGDSIETEIVQLVLEGNSPTLGIVRLRSSAIYPSLGYVKVNSIDGSGNVISGNSFFDVYFEIDLPGSSTTLYNPNPIRMQSSINALPIPAGTDFLKVGTASVQLRDELLDNPAGYICNVVQSVVACFCCVPPRRGDLNGDGADANILDLTFAVDRIFRSGPAPQCDEEGDVNNDGAVCNILDLTKLVDRIFRSGPPMAPCS